MSINCFWIGVFQIFGFSKTFKNFLVVFLTYPKKVFGLNFLFSVCLIASSINFFLALTLIICLFLLLFFCLVPILIAGVPNTSASLIAALEFPIINCAKKQK